MSCSIGLRCSSGVSAGKSNNEPKGTSAFVPRAVFLAGRLEPAFVPRTCAFLLQVFWSYPPFYTTLEARPLLPAILCGCFGRFVRPFEAKSRNRFQPFQNCHVVPQGLNRIPVKIGKAVFCGYTTLDSVLLGA